jgi:hypothetical protein
VKLVNARGLYILSIGFGSLKMNQRAHPHNGSDERSEVNPTARKSAASKRFRLSCCDRLSATSADVQVSVISSSLRLVRHADFEKGFIQRSIGKGQIFLDNLKNIYNRALILSAKIISCSRAEAIVQWLSDSFILFGASATLQTGYKMNEPNSKKEVETCTKL